MDNYSTSHETQKVLETPVFLQIRLSESKVVCSKPLTKFFKFSTCEEKVVGLARIIRSDISNCQGFIFLNCL